MAAAPHLPAALDGLNSRIDKCVRDSRPYELALWVFLGLAALVGISALVYGAVVGNHWLVAAGVGDSGLMSWPLRRLIRLHKSRLALSVIPAITSLLSPRDAAREIHSLIQDLLDKK